MKNIKGNLLDLVCLPFGYLMGIRAYALYGRYKDMTNGDWLFDTVLINVHTCEPSIDNAVDNLSTIGQFMSSEYNFTRIQKIPLIKFWWMNVIGA